MDKKLVGLVGAMSALMPCAAAQALPSIPSDNFQARSFADLLAPVPDAVERLKASDALLAEKRASAAKVELAQYYHHHHHHHHFQAPYYHHHHHHYYHHHHHHYYR